MGLRNDLVENGGRNRTLRLRYLFLFATIFGGSFLIFTIRSGTDLLSGSQLGTTWHSHRYRLVPNDDIFTINTEGCVIPGLQPFDESIKKFITHVKPDSCPHSKYPLLDNNQTHIWIKNENIHHYRILVDTNLSCCYKSFYRPSTIVDISAFDIDNRAEYESCEEFYSYIEVMNEFVKVSCGYEYKTVYEQFFLFAPKKPLLTFKEDLVEIPKNETAFNVIVMGIDAISRLNFYRTMPKTLAYLKKKGAIELLGYNKVGDNTFPNLIPMLLGIKDTDLKRTCWPSFRSTFDNCPFIWDWYKDAGYYTALGEDSSTLGTFNFEKMGFSGTPTDYYIHTFIHEAEEFTGRNKDFNSYLCMGNKYFYQVLLDYIENLTVTLKTSKLFGFFWEVSMSHDYLNYPMLMDDSYEKFLKSIDTSNYLDNTILILLSDHGIRWGDIRYTTQGRLEERLPFVHILLPSSFQENFSFAYENIKTNSKRLTTPFDIYATLSDLVNTNVIRNENIKTRSEKYYAKDRSISLFLPVPENRTCELAGIDAHWCTCRRGQALERDSALALEAGAHVVHSLNVLLRAHIACAPLVLQHVLAASELLPGDTSDSEASWREVMVMVRTAPGNAVFEATLREQADGWQLAGSVSRLNLYADQSRCVHDYHLKLYCYCL